MADEKHLILQLLEHPLTWLFSSGGAGLVVGKWFERRKTHAEARQVDAQSEVTLSDASLRVVQRLEDQLKLQEIRLANVEAENQRLFRRVVELESDNAALRAHIAQLTRREPESTVTSTVTVTHDAPG